MPVNERWVFEGRLNMTTEILERRVLQLEEQMQKLKAWHSNKQQIFFHATIQRLTEVKSQSPEERYMQLLDKHPQIFQRIPMQYIASFLDIEPPSLSRLRKRLSDK